MPGQQMWTDDDRAKALGWQADRADHCPSCGQRQSDWRDENGKELVDPPFELVESVCPSCAWAQEWQQEHRDQDKQRKGLSIGFRRVGESTDEGDDEREE